MEDSKKGLTGTQIKVLGLILMVMDHLYLFFRDYLPSIFGILGRLSAPLFIFMLAEGFYYTRNRKKHILNMYLWALITFIGNNLIEKFFPIEVGYYYLTNNIFLTFAVALSIMYAIDNLKEKNKSFKTIIINILILLVSSLLSLIVEGGIIFVALAVMFYLLRDKRVLKFSIYGIFSLLLGILMLKNNNWDLAYLLIYNNWFMFFSLIPMILYNGEKGRDLNKNFFYIFYPTHMWILYFIKLLVF